MKKVRFKINWVKGRADRHKDWSNSGFLNHLLFNVDCTSSSYCNYLRDITNRAPEEMALTHKMVSEVMSTRRSCFLCNWNGTVVTCLSSFPVQIIFRHGLQKEEPGGLNLRCFALSCRHGVRGQLPGHLKEDVPRNTELEKGQGDFQTLHNIKLSPRFKPLRSGSL